MIVELQKQVPNRFLFSEQLGALMHTRALDRIKRAAAVSAIRLSFGCSAVKVKVSKSPCCAPRQYKSLSGEVGLQEPFQHENVEVRLPLCLKCHCGGESQKAFRAVSCVVLLARLPLLPLAESACREALVSLTAPWLPCPPTLVRTVLVAVNCSCKHLSTQYICLQRVRLTEGSAPQNKPAAMERAWQLRVHHSYFAKARSGCANNSFRILARLLKYATENFRRTWRGVLCFAARR